MAPFSGKRARNAAIWTAGYLGNQRDDAINTMLQGRNQALESIEGGLGDATGTINRGFDDLTSGFGASRDYLAGLRGIYQPLSDIGMSGLRTYADAVGAGGAEGNARALANFQATPGYSFTRDQGTDAILRSASARGMLASGNTSTDLARYVTGLADQTYGNYVSRLQPLLGVAQAGASGLASGQTALADNATREALARTDLGRVLAGLQYGAGEQGAGLYANTANNQARTLLDIASQVAGAISGGMQAGDTADANRFGAMLGGLNLGARLLGSAFGGGGGAGGLLSGLFGARS